MAAPVKKHAPVGRLVFERSSFNDEKERHKVCIAEHYFNSAIHILCPSVSVLAEEIDNILSNQKSYMVKGVSMQLLLSFEFIESFVKRGDIYMLSYGTCIDTDDCIALLPTGTLMLSLTKDTFQHLGLEGKLAKYGKTYIAYEKHIVEVDLLNPKFFPDMKHYERVKWCLSERLDLNFDLLLSWKPYDQKVCSSSVQNYFQSQQCVCNRLKVPKKTIKYENFKVPVMAPNVLQENVDKKKHGNGIPVKTCVSPNKLKDKDISQEKDDKVKPDLVTATADFMSINMSQKGDHKESYTVNFSGGKDTENIVLTDDEENDFSKVNAPTNFSNQSQVSCGYLEVFDWLGACAAGIDMSNCEEEEMDYVSSFTCPAPSEVLKYGTLVEYRGLITPNSVQAVVNYLRTFMKDKDLPWCCVSVHGFMDSPVSWQKRYHGFFNNGDNLYSLLMFKNGTYWLYRALGGKDVVV